MATEQVNPRHRFIKERVLPEIGDISFSFLIDFYFRSIAYYEKARWRGNAFRALDGRTRLQNFLVGERLLF